MSHYDKKRVKLAMYKLYNSLKKMNIKHRHYRQNIRTRYTALIVIQINKINNICIHRNNKLAKI